MILISNIQESIKVDDDFINFIEKIIDFALKEEEVLVDYEVSILLCDNSEIRSVNKEHRNIDKETDVLSFPMLNYENGKYYKEQYMDGIFNQEDLDDGKLVLGDMVLSLEKIEEQSKEFGHSFLREASYLTIHSILHLLGYDHIEEKDKVIMRKREEEILVKLNITR